MLLDSPPATLVILVSCYVWAKSLGQITDAPLLQNFSASSKSRSGPRIRARPTQAVVRQSNCRCFEARDACALSHASIIE